MLLRSDRSRIGGPLRLPTAERTEVIRLLPSGVAAPSEGETLQVYFVSDHTGVTAEMLGRSLLARFEGLAASLRTRSFIDSVEKADALVREIEAARGPRMVLTSISRSEVLRRIEGADALVMDLFEPFLGKLAAFLHREPHAHVGSLHRLRNLARYQERIEAVEFAVGTDDGLGTDHYDRADVILVGVSRVGKTPTSLYLAMHYDLYCANYPLTDEDLDLHELPKALRAHRRRLYGLTIDPLRLHQIRQSRRADSDYSSLKRCQWEVAHVEELFRRNRIPFANTTVRSVEEIAAGLMQDERLELRKGRTREL